MHIKWPGADEGATKLLESISLLLDNNKKILDFLFDPKSPRLRKRAGILRDDAWNLSEEDQLLVRAALDLWSGSGHVQLWELTEAWEPEIWKRFHAAILHLRSTDHVNAR